MNNFKTLVYAISTLSGTIIGVGLFGLPYVTLKVGFWVILGYFLVLGTLVIMVHQFFGELALKTPNFKRLPGFAKIYLGKPGQIVAYISTILSLFGALLAYLIVGGEFFSELLSPFFDGSSLLYTLFYFIIGAALIFFGIKPIAKVEFWGLVLFFIILFVIFFRSQPFIATENLFPLPDWSALFLPYGVILFSLWGAALIPEVEEMLGNQKKMLLKIITIAIFISAVVYLFFIYLVLGISGPQTTETALPGLRAILGDGIVSLALLFGLLTTFTSFITLGLTLKKVFWYDLKMNKNLAFAITCFFPLILFLIGVKQFIPVISFVGAIMLGIDGILILLMYQKIKPERKFLVLPLVLIFLGGIIYEIIY
ncbi:MAG: aromatic amino acid transport family protein [Patescibacteria group bacterium]|nr:aromatic amino acid transport family protein [Patescibacteria group bacterium]